MKKLLLTYSFFMIVLFANAQFTSGRLAVLRVGDSSTALSSTSAPIFLDEFTFAGALTYTKMIDSSGSSKLVTSGSATSEGMITLSSDRNLLIVPGYNASKGTVTIASSTSATNPRAVATVNASGTYTLVASTSANFSANNIRSATSDGTNFWAVGGNTGVIAGTSALSTIVSTTTTNIRGVCIYAGQLFYSTGSGTRGIYRVGSGMPTSASTTSNVYIDAGASASSYQFSFNADTSICYVADDRASSLGGVQKWTRSGSTWSLAYTLGTGVSNIGARGLTVDWSGSNPIIYATSAEGTANRIFKITDTGASSTASTLATSGTNTIYRGIAFTPGSTNSLPVSWLDFKGQRIGNGVELNWSTASEINNDHFEVERSSDGLQFEIIGEVKGAGTSNQLMNYSFVDANNAFPLSYYRIKQVDMDGATAYSKTIIMDQQMGSISTFEVFPNPVQNELTIRTSQTSNVIKVAIYDMIGHLMQSAEFDAKNQSAYSLDTTPLTEGVYLIRINDGQQVIQRRLSK